MGGTLMACPGELQRCALVTGAGRGIGKATALALAAQGLHVVLAGRHAQRLQAAVDEVLAAGGSAQALVGDLSQEAFWQQLAALDKPLAVLVHNASQPAAFGVIEDVPIEDLQAVLSTVLLSGLRLVRACAPHMKQAGYGRIVLVGSLASELGAHGQVAYAAAKSGLQGMVRSLALEVSRFGVTCNLVEPGFIDTERTRDAVAAPIRQALAARSAVGRAGTPQEVAAVIAFLASPAASYVTGACIPVSGGVELGINPRPLPQFTPPS